MSDLSGIRHTMLVWIDLAQFGVHVTRCPTLSESSASEIWTGGTGCWTAEHSISLKYLLIVIYWYLKKSSGHTNNLIPSPPPLWRQTVPPPSTTLLLRVLFDFSAVWREAEGGRKSNSLPLEWIHGRKRRRKLLALETTDYLSPLPSPLSSKWGHCHPASTTRASINSSMVDLPLSLRVWISTRGRGGCLGFPILFQQNFW